MLATVAVMTVTALENMTWVSSAVELEKVACVGHSLIIQTADKTIHSSPCGCDGILQPLSPFC